MDNDRVMKNAFYILVAVAIGFLIGYFFKPKAIQETTITRVDTVRVEVPIPVETEVIRKVSVPVYVPAHADTVVLTRVDSVLVEVPVEIERREYKSEDYRAVVSGAKIGDLRPTLESMEVYRKSESVVVQPKVPWIRPYVSGFAGKSVFGLGAGVEIKGHHGIGADYMSCEGKNAWAVRYTYKF